MTTVLKLLCAAALVVAATLLVSLVRGPDRTEIYRPVEYQPSAGKSAIETAPPADSYSAIWKSRKEAVAIPEKVGGRRLEILPTFILRSVFLVHSPDSVRGFAVIEIGGRENLFTEGAVLPEGFVLALVKSDRIILTRAGKRYILRLSERQLEPLEAAVPAAYEEPEPVPVSVVEPELEELEPVEIYDPSGMPADEIELPAEVFDYALENLHKTLTDVKVRPEMDEDGKMKGLRIDPRKNSLPYKVGFRIGDLITSVNGKSMNSMKDVMDLYSRFDEDPPETMDIIFIRNGVKRLRRIRMRR